MAHLPGSLILTVALVAVLLARPGESGAEPRPSPGALAAMTSASVAYLLNGGLGAHVAIRDSLPEAPFGLRSHRSVRKEFLLGTGTACSPGLPMLITQAAATVLAFQPAATGRHASRVVTLHGAAYFIGALAEPETYRVLRHPRRAGWMQTMVTVGELAIPPLLAVEAERVHRGF